jgi:hypothetical protein
METTIATPAARLETDMTDTIGQIIFGWGSVLAIILRFKYSEQLSDGNVK